MTDQQLAEVAGRRTLDKGQQEMRKELGNAN